MSEAENPDQPSPGRRPRGRWALGVLFVLVAGCALGAALLVGRTLDAPPWLRDRIEARIAQAVPGIAVDFGRMSLRVEREGLARVILWDVDLRNDRGEAIAALADIEAGFAPMPLLRGDMVLRHLQISGAFITLRRGEDGQFGLALGDAFASDTSAPDLPSLIASVDRAFDDPRFASLDGIDADAVTLRYEDARARRGWTADGGRLRLARTGGKLQLGGDVALLSSSGVATLEVNAESIIGQTSAEFGLVLQDLSSGDIATQSPALAWLAALEAPISGALRSGLDPDGQLARLNATLQIGKGVLQPTDATRPVPFDSARAYFTFDPTSGIMAFDDLSVDSPLLSVAAEGRMRLAGLATGWPEAIEGQFRLSQITAAQSAFLASDLAVSGAEADFKLNLSPFEITLGRLRVTDPAFPMRARAHVSATSQGWEVDFDGTARQTTIGQVLTYWPEDFKPQTRRWIAGHIHEGTLHDAVFALRFRPETPAYSYLSFRFDDAHVSYNQKLPSVEGAAGHMTLDGPHLGLRLERGQISPGQGGALDVAGSEFMIADLRAKPSVGQLTLAAQGSLTAALAYADNDSWKLLRRSGRGPDLATGQARLAGRITLPLKRGLKLPDIEIALEGVARNVRGEKIVPGRLLEAREVAVRLDNRVIEASGPVTLSGVAATGQWLQPLQGGTGRVTADVTLDNAALRAFGVTLPRGMLGGRGRGALVIDTPPGQPPAFSLDSDLGGLSLDIPQLGWRLSEAGKGRFEIGGRLGRPVQIEGLSLEAGGLSARGGLELTSAGGFSALTLSQLKVGNWMDVRARIAGGGAGQAPRIAISDGSIDFRKAPTGGSGNASGGSGQGGDSGGLLSLDLERLTVTDSIALTGFQGDFDTSRGLQGRFTGKINGAAQVDGRIIPQNGRLGFRINGEDAGDVLKAAGLLRTVQNGTFRLDLAPVRGQAGTFDGQMTIKGTRLRDAPAIGALLDAVSIVGLLDQLNGPGIFFSEVEARFRLSPDRVVLTRSSAVGPSMGISMDGYYDLGSGVMDMQGVLSPIYFVNGIGRLIARKGEGLIGFNFNLRGSIDSPRVAVNPLSVFTPGMFRDIFRRPPPQVSQ